MDGDGERSIVDPPVNDSNSPTVRTGTQLNPLLSYTLPTRFYFFLVLFLVQISLYFAYWDGQLAVCQSLPEKKISSVLVHVHGVGVWTFWCGLSPSALFGHPGSLVLFNLQHKRLPDVIYRVMYCL